MTYTTDFQPNGLRIEARSVRFDSVGVELVGELYLPEGAQDPLPGVVVGGTWTSVRQQMTQRYAAKLAAEGLAALSFDFGSYGESGGELGQIESPRGSHENFGSAAYA